MVLLHGLGESHIGCRPVIGALAAEYDVIAIDLPGFGCSPVLPPTASPTAANLAAAEGTVAEDRGSTLVVFFHHQTPPSNIDVKDLRWPMTAKAAEVGVWLSTTAMNPMPPNGKPIDRGQTPSLVGLGAGGVHHTDRRGSPPGRKRRTAARRRRGRRAGSGARARTTAADPPTAGL